MFNRLPFLFFFHKRCALLAVSALSLAIPVVPLFPQALPNKTHANELLQKTIESQDLQSAEGPPFHLVAHVRYTLGGKTSDGVYEVLWESQGRFRENFQLEKMTEIDVVLANKIYILRNTATLTPQFQYLRNFVHHPISLYLGSRSTAHKIYSDVNGEERRSCIVPSENQNDKICLDPATNLVVSVNLESPVPSQPYDLREEDFVSLGTRRYPRLMTRRIPGQTIEVKVERLAEATSFGPDVFVPPLNSEARDWCLHPSLAPGHYFHASPFPKTSPPGIFFPYYILTGTDGHIKKFISLNPSASQNDPAIAKWIRDANFPIWVCGSKPIENEVIRMNGPE